MWHLRWVRCPVDNVDEPRRTGGMHDLLAGDGHHVFDGAMGTALYDRGVFVNVCYDELNLSQPEIVTQVHAEYVRAGAEIIETNTFGANPVKLSSYALENRTEEINEAAVKIARRAGAPYVAGAIGPLGVRIEPLGPTGREEAECYFAKQITGLLAGGVDCLVLETFSDLSEITCALTAARRATDLPVFAQMTVERNGRTAYDTTPAKIAKRLTEVGADVIGLNCSVGPAVMLDAAEEMAAATDLPLSAQPNAGLPRSVRDRKIYMASPDYMARYALRLAETGVRFIGGCCGTTPAHTLRMAEVLGSGRPRRSAPKAVATAAPTDREGRKAKSPPSSNRGSALGERSALGRKLANGDTVVSVELLPPRGWRDSGLANAARALHTSRADAIALVDHRHAGRLGPVEASVIAGRESGLECLVHYACRGRGMFEMVSDLLGAAALDVRNLLVVSGDPSPFGPYEEASGQSEIDSIGLTNVITGLNRGEGPGGEPIGTPTSFVHGVAANPAASDLELELERLAYKAEAGACFAVTQPIFDPEALSRFVDLTRPLSIPLIAGIWPITDLGNAELLANEIPGIVVPAEIVERVRRAEARGGDDAASEEGIVIAREMMSAVSRLVRGFHVTAPSRRVKLALRVLDGLPGTDSA